MTFLFNIIYCLFSIFFLLKQNKYELTTYHRFVYATLRAECMLKKIIPDSLQQSIATRLNVKYSFVLSRLYQSTYDNIRTFVYCLKNSIKM